MPKGQNATHRRDTMPMAGIIAISFAGRIHDLERARWEFDTRKEGGDYVYIVVAKPKPRQLSFIWVP